MADRAGANRTQAQVRHPSPPPGSRFDDSPLWTSSLGFREHLILRRSRLDSIDEYRQDSTRDDTI